MLLVQGCVLRGNFLGKTPNLLVQSHDQELLLGPELRRKSNQLNLTASSGSVLNILSVFLGHVLHMLSGAFRFLILWNLKAYAHLHA